MTIEIVGNIVVKGEIAHHEQFPILPQCFQKSLIAETSDSECRPIRAGKCWPFPTYNQFTADDFKNLLANVKHIHHLEFNYQNELNTLWQKEKLLALSNFSFWNNVFKIRLLWSLQKASICGNGLKGTSLSERTYFGMKFIHPLADKMPLNHYNFSHDPSTLTYYIQSIR